MQPVHLRLDETTGSAEDRRKAWQDALSVSADVEFPAESAWRFAGSMSVYPLGPVAIGDIVAAPHTVFRTTRTIARCGLDHIYLAVFPRAGFRAELRGRRAMISDGDCVAFDQKSPVRMEYGDMRCIFLLVPRPIMLRHLGSIAGLDGLHLPAASPQARLMGQLLTTLAGTAPDLPGEMAHGIAENLLGLLVSCLRMPDPAIEAGGRLDIAQPRPSRRGQPLPRIRRFIDRNVADQKLGAASLCVQFGLSRTALYRLFQPFGGVHDYILSRRTELARRWLMLGHTSPLTLQEIARRCGFSDDRSFRRAIQKAFGASPREIRKAATSMPSQRLPENDPFSAFYDSYSDPTPLKDGSEPL